MITVLESIQLSTEYLDKKGIESPRMNAELLLADILNCKRLDLYLKFDQPLKEEETAQYREYIKRRGKFEPLQYVTGWTEFYGMKFHVNKNVLIPRPETEILIETILERIDKSKQYKILDIGTGSGNIPIVLGKQLPDVEIISIDISEEALNVAASNAATNNLNNVAFIKKDVFSQTDLNELGLFDIIISNPPYVSHDEFLTLQLEIKGYEPKVAVTDNGDGFKFYKHICSAAKNLLNAKGKIFFEVGKDQSEQVAEIMNGNNFGNISIKKDLLKIDRVVYGELE
ncbi:MAG: peptide chain release factor N(5)-glutamine methyltransferase [bacterium]